MKVPRLHILIATVLLVAGFHSAAMADDKSIGDADTNWQEHITSTQSRAEVKAELKQAREQGLFESFNDGNYPGRSDFQSTRSRDEVRREAIEAVRSGEAFANDNYMGYQ